MCNTFSVKSGGFFLGVVPRCTPKNNPRNRGSLLHSLTTEFFATQKNLNFPYENARIQKEKEACIIAKEKKVAYRAPAAQAYNNPSHDIVWL